ncbi:MAG: YebC/PmpR family DNA-binding transcriptional regulator [Rickettsiaceae bacterium H1]|nr:YebC/PmpR family DNA-binding transcriptional regulator [Rickettsiaceae bacterium H1]
MAGHSQFSNIKYRKEAQDAKRATKFTKLRREIIVAARSGLPDPELNPRLRSALITAHREGLPKDKIDNAIKNSTGNNKDEDYREVRYEGYASGGAAVILETLTDNRNRTAGELRFIFSRNGGNLAEVGSVSYLFDHLGIIIYGKNNEEIFDFALENNATDIEESNDSYRIICEVKEFGILRDLLYEKFGEPNSANLMWQPKDKLALTEDNKEKVGKLLDALEDNDDVQSVYSNA